MSVREAAIRPAATGRRVALVDGLLGKASGAGMEVSRCRPGVAGSDERMRSSWPGPMGH